MSSFESAYLNHAKVRRETLVPFGFVFNGDNYLLERLILGGEFLLRLTVDTQGQMDSSLLEVETNETYTLYKVEAAHGEYVGAIRDAVKEVILEVKKHCYETGYHVGERFAFLRDYCHETYGEDLEYLWDDENCILRRSDNKKWYAVIMKISLRKIGLDDDSVKSVLGLRGNPEKIDGVKIFQGYHMNKKYWVIIVLDERVDNDFIKEAIEQSRELALKKGKR